ncbi:hypothetical protein [Bacillus xiapuensis]|uniref:Uncharacterized protein n=1 Tax=Bacillus xiapuensis TaxID=2014075 RepID=A0ABU6NAV6_9BACI|nr:hypothetical protein [Bacillus xiapuensis]
MTLLEGEVYILNEKATSGLPQRIGERCVIIDCLSDSLTYDYEIEFDDSTTAKVKESELNKLTPDDVEWMSYIFTANKVKYGNEIAKIKKIDYLNRFAEILFKDGSSITASFYGLKPIEMEVDSVEEFKFRVEDKVKTHTQDEQCNGLIGSVVSTVLTDDNIREYKVLTGDNIYFFEECELELVEESTQELPFSDIDEDNTIPEDLLSVFFDHYKNDDDTYTIPKQLLINMLTQMYE